MTIGQRIAQKRKELGLSQEGLGEQLGVSRQAIYKWESDAALPEVEKLITLSRIFSVSVGWLLGVEEDAPSQGQSGELTEAQLQMVKEIVDGYLAARPEPAPPKPRLRSRLALVGVALILIGVLVSLFSRLDRMNTQYNNLQYSISNIQHNVNTSIGSITSRVEEILKSQNNLTADYSTEVESVDPGENRVTFSFRAVPKTFEEGMVAWIDAVNDGEHAAFGPYQPDRETFSGRFTLPLTDSTVLYIVFEHDGVRQTQLLDTYTGLYSESLPQLWLDCWPLFFAIDDKTNTLTEDLYAKADLTDNEVGISSLRIGLFADRKPVAWFTPTTRTIMNNHEEVTEQTNVLYKDGIVLDREKAYCIAAVVVDVYGREFMVTDVPTVWDGVYWAPLTSYQSGYLFEIWAS
ncbi:MAG: helix-turn-helix domain-containing protein [Oscillospiraceae bacterium]|nr:helix-turn-helix domain-containing protein [Oscillospiraceae bacterium]